MILTKKIFEFHAQVQKCHFGKIEQLPKWHFWTCAWNSKKFWPKDFFWTIMIAPYPKNIHNMFQGRPKPGSAKVQSETFLKKDSQHFKNSWQFGFLWIYTQQAWKANWKVPFLMIFIIVKKECETASEFLKNSEVIWFFQSELWLMFLSFFICQIKHQIRIDLSNVLGVRLFALFKYTVPTWISWIKF